VVSGNNPQELRDLVIHHHKSLTDEYGVGLNSEIWNRLMVHYTPKHEAGSIRRKSKSASLRANAWIAEESPISRLSSGKQTPGTAA
jgi:hypothetical protein